MSFLLPPALPAEMTRELQFACLAGGFDSAPGPTYVRIQGRRLILQRAVDESGFVITPWSVPGVGRVMTATPTLIERPEPYSLPVELARGKVNQVRNHIAEWPTLGIQMTPELEAGLQDVNNQFGHVLARHPSVAADEGAEHVLRDALKMIDQLMPHYADELFRLRHQRIPRLETALGCQLSSLPGSPEALTDTFNTLRLALTWQTIEPAESKYDWSAADAVIDWAERRSVPVVAGPLIEFSAASLPEWLSGWEGDLSNLANFMCDYVETVIARYRGRIRRWYIATACNVAGVLGLSEDDLLWLTARLCEAALQIAPELEIVLGVSQPWADYMAREEHTYTPLVFLDTLLRTGLKPAALDVQLIMGVAPHGSYWRDLLEVSRLLDSYAVLSTPVQVTLAVPSAADKDELSDQVASVTLGIWNDGYDAAVQSDRGRQIAALALSKPFVNGVYWAQVSDAQPHLFPHCGVLDASDRPKPVLASLRQLRESHLR